MKKFAVILSGSGYKEGSEITEAVSCLISINQNQAQYRCFAPKHLMEDSAKICRDKIENIEHLNADDFDGLVFPGGFGSAKHLSNWIEAGASCKVLPTVTKLIQSFYEQQKPIAACCISPVLLAKVLGHEEITVTIGNDMETAKELEKTSAVHEECPVDDFVTDRAHRILTTPAYMYGEAQPDQVFKGIQLMIKELVELA